MPFKKCFFRCRNGNDKIIHHCFSVISDEVLSEPATLYPRARHASASDDILIPPMPTKKSFFASAITDPIDEFINFLLSAILCRIVTIFQNK